jgi:molybdopterin-guanine dinucleotide biosynthesis protein A
VPRVAGLVLTGGASRRLGVDKAMLRVDDELLAERVARVLAAVADPVIEVGPGYTALPATREDPPGDGPLAALVAGAAALRARAVAGPAVVLAVDLPFVDEATVRWLATHESPDTVVPFVDGEPQTLCARYSEDALIAAAGVVASGKRSLRALLAVVPVHEAREDEWGGVTNARAFGDIDTPDDLTRSGLVPPG